MTAHALAAYDTSTCLAPYSHPRRRPKQTRNATTNRRVDLVVAFAARADARAYLWSIGEYSLPEAVDQLQADAERHDLIARCGQDYVRRIPRKCFRSIPRGFVMRHYGRNGQRRYRPSSAPLTSFYEIETAEEIVERMEAELPSRSQRLCNSSSRYEREHELCSADHIYGPCRAYEPTDSLLGQSRAGNIGGDGEAAA